MITLKGMTWDHSRGYDPMVATAAAYSAAHPDVTITWQKRSLKEFGDYPIEKLSDLFDLLVIDHPFVGFAAHSRCILPLDTLIEPEYLADQAAHSVGASHPSYFYGGHQWALAIDAAGQVSSYRADLLDSAVPATWEDVLALARRQHSAGNGRYVAIPSCPIDSLMSFFSIAAAYGEDPCATPDIVLSRQMGRFALGLLVELVGNSHPHSREWNPIQMYNAMSSTDEIVYCPLAFGYSNYGRPGYASKLLNFANTPKQSPASKGAILGGTGYALSARVQDAAALSAAVDYGKFVASGDVQEGLYFTSGGQPGHRQAWLSDAVNAQCNGFFHDTLGTLDHAYLRPRYYGYMQFQEESWYAVHEYLMNGGDADALLDRLDETYRHTLTLEKGQAS
ncbi:MAG: carbohydrate ABC transporter substrate-binding protein [Anaerolineae bacterium]